MVAAIGANAAKADAGYKDKPRLSGLVLDYNHGPKIKQLREMSAILSEYICHSLAPRLAQRYSLNPWIREYRSSLRIARFRPLPSGSYLASVRTYSAHSNPGSTAQFANMPRETGYGDKQKAPAVPRPSSRLVVA